MRSAELQAQEAEAVAADMTGKYAWYGLKVHNYAAQCKWCGVQSFARSAF